MSLTENKAAKFKHHAKVAAHFESLTQSKYSKFGQVNCEYLSFVLHEATAILDLFNFTYDPSKRHKKQIMLQLAEKLVDRLSQEDKASAQPLQLLIHWWRSIVKQEDPKRKLALDLHGGGLPLPVVAAAGKGHIDLSTLQSARVLVHNVAKALQNAIASLPVLHLNSRAKPSAIKRAMADVQNCMRKRHFFLFSLDSLEKISEAHVLYWQQKLSADAQNAAAADKRNPFDSSDIENDQVESSGKRSSESLYSEGSSQTEATDGNSDFWSDLATLKKLLCCCAKEMKKEIDRSEFIVK